MSCCLWMWVIVYGAGDLPWSRLIDPIVVVLANEAGKTFNKYLWLLIH